MSLAIEVATTIQISTHQRNDSLLEENLIWARPVGPTLETVAPIYSFTCVEAAMVSPPPPKYLHCVVQSHVMYICNLIITSQSYGLIYPW